MGMHTLPVRPVTDQGAHFDVRSGRAEYSDPRTRFGPVMGVILWYRRTFRRIRRCRTPGIGVAAGKPEIAWVRTVADPHVSCVIHLKM